MTQPRQQHRPDSETLAAFAEGRLTGAARASVVEHLDGCEECMTELTLAMQMAKGDARETARPTFGRRGRIVAAAASLIVGVAGMLWWNVSRGSRTALDTLVAMAPRDARPVEPRLTGGFAWAAYRGSARASAGSVDAERMKLVGAAGELVARAGSDPDADAQHAAGVALVLVQDPGAAVAYLEKAAQKANDAKNWSDLAAAIYAAAAERQRDSLYAEALAAADRALRLDPALPEALFNRALILERMRIAAQARRAWARYLEVDPSSRWAEEARAHLAALPAATASSRFERDRPLLERAAAAGDLDALRPLVERHRERSRAFAETEYLGLWGETLLRGDDAEAGRMLAMARAIGEVLARVTGESLLRDSVRVVDDADAATRLRLAEGHARYRRGRLQYARNQLGEARGELLRAAETLAADGDPMEWMARVYAAGIRLTTEEAPAARMELERLFGEAAARPQFLAFGAQTRWELGRAHLFDGDPASAIPLLRDGSSLLRRGGERVREAFVEALLATALVEAGRGDESWSAQIRAFEALSAEDAPNEWSTSLAGAVRSELMAGRRDAALALARLDDPTARPGARPADVVDALVQRALLESAGGSADDALAAARQAELTAARVSDPLLRERLAADAALALGAARSQREPRQALAALTRAVGYYRAHDLAILLPEPLLVRARCALRTGDAAAAARDLEDGMTVVAAHAQSDALQGGALDASRALFDEAIRLALDGGDVRRAFALAERSHGGSIDAAALQRRVAGSGAAVLTVVALPEEIVTFAVSESAFAAERRPRTRESLAALAKESLGEREPHAAAELYDDVIRPAAAIVHRAQRLVIVPDRLLAAVPFAALFDRAAKRHLIEQLPVAMATSVTSLERRVSGEAQPTLAAFALASGAATGTRGLPAVADELEQISRLYPKHEGERTAAASFSDVRRARAEVLHIAGHTEAQPGGGEHAFLFGGGAAGIERVTWKDITAAAPLHAEVAVLSACETLRAPASARTRAPALGAAFSAAGVADVAGTLGAVNDRDAQTLFLAFHREVAAGADAAVALQRAQRAAIGDGASWKSVALLTRRIPIPRDEKEKLAWAR